MKKDRHTEIRDLIIHDLSEHLPRVFEPILPPDMSLKDIEKMIDEGVEMVLESSVILRFMENDLDKREKVGTIVLQVTKLLLGLKIVAEGGTMEPNPEDYKELRQFLEHYYSVDEKERSSEPE